eukprot:2699769-Pleurochrysis_carterae.AAC.1
MPRMLAAPLSAESMSAVPQPGYEWSSCLWYVAAHYAIAASAAACKCATHSMNSHHIDVLV